MSIRSRLALVGGAVGLLACSPVGAQAACVSTPINATWADPAGDGEYGVAPEVIATNFSVNDGCTASISYSIIGQSSMLASETLIWFVDVDGNRATGSTGAFAGADIGVGRLQSYAGVSRWDPLSASFQSGEAVAQVGTFGAAFDLTKYTGFGARVATIAGGASWKSSQSGESYYDWTPEPGLLPYSQLISLSEYIAPLPQAPAVPAAPAAPVTPAAPVAPAGAPSTAPAPSAEDEGELVCEVPRARKQTVVKVKQRLRDGGCKPGRIRSKFSTSVKKGLVIGLAEDAGTVLDRDESVAIFVSKGPRKARATRAEADSAASRFVELVNEANER